MTKELRHLHGDYHHAWCGEDASHILMTYVEDEANCALCKAYHDAYSALEASWKKEEAESRRACFTSGLPPHGPSDDLASSASRRAGTRWPQRSSRSGQTSLQLPRG